MTQISPLQIELVQVNPRFLAATRSMSSKKKVRVPFLDFYQTENYESNDNLPLTPKLLTKKTSTRRKINEEN